MLKMVKLQLIFSFQKLKKNTHNYGNTTKFETGLQKVLI